MRLKLILLVLFLINLNDSGKCFVDQTDWFLIDFWSIFDFFDWFVDPQKAIAIKCFQCDSNIDLECSEYFDPDMTSLQSKSCDNVFEARFCIKTTGMFGGKSIESIISKNF